MYVGDQVSFDPGSLSIQTQPMAHASLFGLVIALMLGFSFHCFPH